MWPLNIVPMKSTPTVPGWWSNEKHPNSLSIQVATLDHVIVWAVFLCVSFLSSAPAKSCVCVSFHLMEIIKHLGNTVCSLPPAIFYSLGNRIRATLDRYIANFLVITIVCSSWEKCINVKNLFLSCISLVCNFSAILWSPVLLESRTT